MVSAHPLHSIPDIMIFLWRGINVYFKFYSKQTYSLNDFPIFPSKVMLNIPYNEFYYFIMNLASFFGKYSCEN